MKVHDADVFIKEIWDKRQITKAFLVTTSAYKGYVFHVDNVKDDMFQLSADEEKALQSGPEFIDRGY
jgi:hypothetical protein